MQDIVEIEVGTNYDPLSNVTAKTISGETVTLNYITEPNEFNTNYLNSYTVTYTATSESGNTNIANAIINIIDKELPVIHVVNSNITISVGEEINLLDGVTATDNVDGDLTTGISYKENPAFDNNKIGSYQITYIVKDSSRKCRNSNKNHYCY